MHHRRAVLRGCPRPHLLRLVGLPTPSLLAAPRRAAKPEEPPCIKYTTPVVLLLLVLSYLIWELHIEITVFWHSWIDASSQSHSEGLSTSSAAAPRRAANALAARCAS